MGVQVSECKHWANGGKGTMDLAKKVVKACKGQKQKFKFYTMMIKVCGAK